MSLPPYITSAVELRVRLFSDIDFVARNTDFWQAFTNPSNPAPIKLHISDTYVLMSSRVQLSSASTLIPTLSAGIRNASSPNVSNPMSSTTLRKPPSNLIVLNTSYNPKAKANSQPMQISDKEKNLKNTLQEQTRAENGVVVENFCEFETLVSADVFFMCT